MEKKSQLPGVTFSATQIVPICILFLRFANGEVSVLLLINLENLSMMCNVQPSLKIPPCLGK